MTNKIRRHTARFGARYGVSVKKRYEAIEEKQRRKHLCPKCGFEKVQRVSTGIFNCKKCNAKYAGGAFYPQTLSGGIISKMVDKRAFTPALAALLNENANVVVETNEDVVMTDEQKIDSLMKKPSRRKEKKEEKKEEETIESEEANETDDSEDE